MAHRMPAMRKLALLATSGMLLAACSETPITPPSKQPTADPGLVHVHGLGIDPADGTLYAASHYGLFRIPATDRPARVTESRQDTMGFTVVGPRHFLGSGHPDPAQDGPNHLGLIESTDAGQNWRSLSLSGAADFHALEAKHNQVYGYDGQTRRLLVSTDRQNWDPRVSVALADFAVSPIDPNTLLATTERGLARSTDGGRTFTPVSNAPDLLLVDWPSATVVLGITPDGSVHTSQDAGATWSQQGKVPGESRAVTANGSGEVHIATESAIHTSLDGGRTFSVRAQLR
ncbi:F510_1955 family glycosylhydrolase [Kibdelosporangium persicum]|uniref:BNR repeat-containing glycosyl hydrolase n=1 Tax=Kibdelosporangium persicum TaxID=2698649 RepID=A0ABX2FDF0_9PSEU|nr:exo-alpha-sialidase [Kibdelosporangium persicum]NRN69149.1 BNR repeat-containing glycosyl hydrolase [Kibdelosporangium persicum]